MVHVIDVACYSRRLEFVVVDGCTGDADGGHLLVVVVRQRFTIRRDTHYVLSRVIDVVVIISEHNGAIAVAITITVVIVVINSNNRTIIVCCERTTLV